MYIGWKNKNFVNFKKNRDCLNLHACHFTGDLMINNNLRSYDPYDELRN
jgi:hypothetical protein